MINVMNRLAHVGNFTNTANQITRQNKRLNQLLLTDSSNEANSVAV